MSFQNPVIANRGTDHGDPAVIYYDGVYYLYHTGQYGVPVYTSMNLVDWTFQCTALEASIDKNHWAQIDLWAPEVFYANGLFYMYVTGARTDEHGFAEDEKRNIGVAKSRSPLGPFQLNPAPLVEEWSIDAHPFMDSDGEMYLFYNVRNAFTTGPGNVIGTGNVVDKMIDLETLAGNPALVVRPEFSWEGNKENSFFWNEGPFVKERNGIYYQMYSAGFFGDDTYGVFYATSDQPWTDTGMQKTAWEKWRGGTPVLSTNRECHGPGHHVVMHSPDQKEDYVVFHGYVPSEQVQERRVWLGRLFWKDQKLVLEEPKVNVEQSPNFPELDLRKCNNVNDLNEKLAVHFENNFLCDFTAIVGSGLTIRFEGGNHTVSHIKLTVSSGQPVIESEGFASNEDVTWHIDPNEKQRMTIKKMNGRLLILLNQIEAGYIKVPDTALKLIFEPEHEANISGLIWNT